MTIKEEKFRHAQACNPKVQSRVKASQGTALLLDSVGAVTEGMGTAKSQEMPNTTCRNLSSKSVEAEAVVVLSLP